LISALADIADIFADAIAISLFRFSLFFAILRCHFHCRHFIFRFDYFIAFAALMPLFSRFR
jgi:hypothetical protein